MTARIATAEDVGRPCPYCRFPVKEGVPVHACDACGSVHHAECWADGGGCAVFGCVAAGTAQQPIASGPPQAYDTPSVYQPTPSVAPPPPPPMPPGPTDKGWQEQRTGVRPLTVALAAVVGLLGIGVGAAIAGGVFGSNPHPTPTVVTVHQHTSSEAHGTSPSQENEARGSVVSALHAYERAYSDRSISELSAIFATDIRRHGLSGSGCSVVRGKPRVLEDYEQQFEAGTGSYTLVGLNPSQVRLEGPNHAEVHSHYEISPGGSGFVNFKLTGTGSEWKISEVYATCA